MSGKISWSSTAGKLTVLIVVMCFASYATGKKSEVESLINGIVNWGDKLSTPGASIDLKLIKSGEKDGHIFSSYNPVITGAPRDQSYALFQLSIGQTEPVLAAPALYISEDGGLCQEQNMCHDGTGPIVQLSFLPAKGEPYRLALVSKDTKYKIVAMVIPNPILADDQGCHVEVIRATPKFEIAILRGKGFKPKETFKYTSNSAGEVIQGSIKVDAKGEFVLALEPFVKGKDLGNDEVTLAASNCAPKVTYLWGNME